MTSRGYRIVVGCYSTGETPLAVICQGCLDARSVRLPLVLPEAEDKLGLLVTGDAR